VGARPPVGPSEYLPSETAGQPPRCYARTCLLKGCEQSFQPAHPLQGYCSQACQQAARRWRRWQAARRYRATAPGQQQRREQSRRYRERQRARQATVTAEAVLTAAVAEEREGQRYEHIWEDFSTRPCQRPGCYELFVFGPHEPPQRFCCSACRRALRRVLEREARWRRRQRLIDVGRFRPVPRC
jgi:hypothetical protein